MEKLCEKGEELDGKKIGGALIKMHHMLIKF